MRQSRHGYTIIELLVVMAVLGILATAAMPLLELTVKRNKERELKQALWEMRRAIDAYKLAYDGNRIAKVSGDNGYPPSLLVLVSGVPDRLAAGQTIFFLRRIPKDPFAPSEASPEQSWGLRSYTSTAEQPKAGENVFDIYSKSEGVGMNGVPYKQW
ncbi:type II secretion system protein [Undibacterium flavidum]|uniref:Type II secretion system protein n=1 Tax=Undibacterium flavidum TaxID=2762297 RepID=A0ABR6YB19_9BURK|nr:type II secretion system protein [Undibacterium flavidum]MBC3873837.1 type II secretion system protein [Undibacterium flavidum]